MITELNHRALALAQQIYVLQQAAYTVERDLIGYVDFPPLQVTAQEIQAEPETFLGFWQGEEVVGVLSFATTADALEIGRLIVHPQAFRRGIAGALLQAVEGYLDQQRRLTVSTAAKNLPAIQLYQKHGYQLTRHTRLPDGLELVHFCKDVAPQPTPPNQAS